MRQIRFEPVILLLVLASGLCVSACRGGDARERITPEYDKTTGKLTLLKYDANGDGTPDTFSYMDGARVVRIEIDKDQDGKIERWEYYDAKQALEKIGFSRPNDGKVDAWSFMGPDGQVARVEISTQRDGKITRIEQYRQGKLTTAEEDTDGDGRMDKWEAYEGERLTSVAFDTLHRGTPDRRLVYAADGSARLEIDDKGDGRFVAASANSKPAPGNRQ